MVVGAVHPGKKAGLAEPSFSGREAGIAQSCLHHGYIREVSLKKEKAPISGGLGTTGGPART